MKTDRRQFLQQAMSGAVAPLLIGAEGPANQHGGGAGLKGVTLENDLIRAVFDPATGALLEFSNTQTDRHFQHRRELGRSFVLVAPLPERLLHVIDGLHQYPQRSGRVQMASGWNSPGTASEASMRAGWISGSLP
jgi:hypothetical protein